MRHIAPRRAALATFAVLAASMSGPATADGPTDRGHYVGAGTTVSRNDGQPGADDGSVTCDPVDGSGSGGVCLPFGGGDAVEIADQTYGGDVPFQVCVDNNGDGFCTSPDSDPSCPDVIAFSHSDDGSFFNPVGPVPTGFTQGCPGGEWRGYVVFLCQGEHQVGTDVHSHAATAGTGTVTSGGEGSGMFCGGSVVRVSRKPYFLVRDGNATCALKTSNDATGLINQDPNVQMGSLHGGPWHTRDPYNRTVTSTTQKCWVQINQADMGFPNGTASAEFTGTGDQIPPGGAVVLFTAAAVDVVYVCSRVEWTTPAGSDRYDFDADPGTPGTQCARALAVPTSGGTVLTVEPTVH